MDDHLVALWRRGEPRAALQLRRHLSALVEHLWLAGESMMSPASGGGGGAANGRSAADSDRIVQIVREALQGQGRSAAELKERCVRATALQRATMALAQDSEVHPSAAELVSHALGEGGGVGLAEVEAHLPICAVCTDILRTTTQLRRAAVLWAPAEEVAPARQPARPVRRTRRRRRKAPRPGDAQAWPSPLAAWPIVFVVGLLIWWGANRGEDRRLETADSRFAKLVDRTPPAPLHPADLPSEARDALRDLRRGDCTSASARLRSARRKHPGHTDLRMLEGETFVCVGDGAEALDAVVGLQGQVPPGALSWTLARAHLLMGQPEAAKGHLGKVIKYDQDLKGRAQVLLVRVAEVQAGG